MARLMPLVRPKSSALSIRRGGMSVFGDYFIEMISEDADYETLPFDGSMEGLVGREGLEPPTSCL